MTNLECKVKRLIKEYSELKMMAESNVREARMMGLTERYIDKA